jgi:signal transduction histidine kinase
LIPHARPAPDLPHRLPPRVTFQRKLLLGFAIMSLPVLLLGAEAFRANVLERRALEALGASMARTRTYAEVETAMFDETEVIWRYLTGLDPKAREEFRMTGEVVNYWFDRWSTELGPDEAELVNGVRQIHHQIQEVADSVFRLYDSGHHEAAYRAAQIELKQRLQPALTELNHQIYRRAREFSVQHAFGRVEGIVETERVVLSWIAIATLVAGLLTSYLISRSLARPVNELTRAMAVAGAGDLEHRLIPSTKDEIGELAGAFATMTANLRESRSDLERLNAELGGKVEQLERTQAQLVQSEKLASIGEMAAAVAHGMRNPLASLRAVAQLAIRHQTPGAGRDHLGEIVEQVDRLDRRIAHLLSFSRPAPFRPLRENVGDLVQGVMSGVAELLRDRNVEARVDLPLDLPEVRVDPMQLEQVMVEIISNAVNAMPGGGRLEIGATVGTGLNAAPTVTVQVTDQGGGIPEEAMPSICEPFFTTRPEGTGLGLAIAKRYVEQHGGRLEITSTVGQGTTVRVHLPVAAADEAPRSSGRAAEHRV